MSEFQVAQVVVVRGSGDVGSAVAHALYMRGARVIVHDDPAPAHLRRRMSFADALFDGRSTLDGVVARHAHDLEALHAIEAVDEQLPVCDAPLDALLAKYKPDVLIDARMRKRALIEDQRPLAPVVIGLGPGFDTHANCNIAIETAWGDDLGKVVRDGPTRDLSGEPRPLGGVGRERFIYAPQGGHWRTRLAIGSPVDQGQEVGRLNDLPIAAPLSGVLRGLCHDGVTVSARQKLVEVDPRANTQVTSLGERPRAIAEGVLTAIDLQADAQLKFFAFERSFEAALDCMPMSVRFKMDLCGLKLSLTQWRTLSAEARRTVLDARCVDQVDVRRLRRFIELTIKESGGVCPNAAPIDDSAWRHDMPVPEPVRAALRSVGVAQVPETAWAGLNDLQRFALCKLASRGSTRNLVPALQEFGLLRSPP
ncbi:nitrate reductase associated protein [Variovorax sp. V116]|uniref:nitrate reductase associated protein n=1 Tax=Variovorax sp. V116 TaxID=3065953 RepID=UPI0034E8A6AF